MNLSPNAKVTIAIDIDVAQLPRVPDDHLAMLWHVAQFNPAAFADQQAGELVQKISWEIIRRWLGNTPPSMYNHQPRQYHWQQLCRFASYRDGDWHPDPDKLARYEAEQAQAAEDGDS
ncbi:hypothetical protein [Streptomyces sp. CRN 30]|uniref:hypothetical protein n=1 Tax=Streptomyces sp. CRN 30 TaxID=3075613 RepID=UPI002A812418|nr:hypothetical protein [Streptomyces sp. CRN 30]